MILQGFTCSSAVMLPGIITRFVCIFVNLSSVVCLWNPLGTSIVYRALLKGHITKNCFSTVWVFFIFPPDTLRQLVFWHSHLLWNDVWWYFSCMYGTTSLRMTGKWREGGLGLLSGVLVTINPCICMVMFDSVCKGVKKSVLYCSACSNTYGGGHWEKHDVEVPLFFST